MIGDCFRDKDARCDGRFLHVVYVATAPQETKAVCISRGKVTLIEIDRLLDESRFERVPAGVVA